MIHAVTCIVVACSLNALQAQQPPASPEQIRFFEAKIRPLFIEHCYACHSAEKAKAKGNLQLDTHERLMHGGDTGPVIVPGQADASLLIKAVRYANPDLQMPPKGKLSKEQIADLEAWIKMGAPYPKSAPGSKPSAQNDPKKHWAFQPIQNPLVPMTKSSAAGHPIDAFVLEKLRQKGLDLSPAADKRTLLRRVYFDLIGLPPTYEAIVAFENDSSGDAYEKVVDWLLASPRYGERWARHWLDVARYADTKDGVLMYGDDRIRPFAYTYRDYVIRALNEDLPFDRFLHEQLAADQITPPVEPWRLSALGFLTLGRMFDGNVHDVIDDQIDVVSRGILGLTVSCARCHDHKYDPIPTADYYSLHGVFANTEVPLVSPRLDQSSGPEPFEKNYAGKIKEIQNMLDQQHALLSETARARAGDYLVHIATTPPDPLETAIFFFSLAPEDFRPPIVARWRALVKQRAVPGDPIFGVWHDLMALPDEQFIEKARQLVAQLPQRSAVNPRVRGAIAQAKLQAKIDVARTYGQLLKQVHEESKKPAAMPDPATQQLLELLNGQNSPGYFPKSQTRRYMSRAETDAFGTKLLELDKLAVKEAAAPARAMTLTDSSDHYNPHIFVRGNPAAAGKPVPRQFLEVISNAGRQPFARGSGRLDLADALTSTANPLTARVIVNRVWMHHFGEPLVENPSDFGLRTPRPVQAALLDHLATKFRQDGWSLKKLHRYILLSKTYGQSGQMRPEAQRIDPENRLLWRVNRQRLDLEAMRDAMLCVSGQLEHKLYGRPAEIAYQVNVRRRTIYGMVDRQSLPGLYRAFDFASPDVSSERRSLTTVPQQALFGLNSGFVLDQAKALADQIERSPGKEDRQRIQLLYRTILQREPSETELSSAARYLSEVPISKQPSSLKAWGQLAQVLLLTNEFLYVD